MADREERAASADRSDPAERTAGEHPRRARRRILTARKSWVLFLLGALLPILLGGLMFARAAQAATTASATAAAAAATSAATAAGSPGTAAATTAKTVPTASGPCAIPIVGDLGSLTGLCGAGSGIAGDINNICSPGTEQPELATAGINAMIDVPGGTTPGALAAGKGTLYDNYGVAGQNWAAYGLQCSDMTSLIGNDVADMTFNFAKSLDRLTITVYQSAAGNGILGWLSGDVDRLISALGDAIYFPYLAPVVILGAIWLAWQGLVRKRATRTIEGTIWMVFACVAAIWLIGRPGDFTNIGTSVSNSVTNVMNVAFAKLPAPQNGDCLPVTQDPDSVPNNYSFTSGNDLVDQNANELWTALVCKPWLQGEFGTTEYTGNTRANQPQTIVDQYGRPLLWAQAIGVNDGPATPALITEKQQVYQGIATEIQAKYPAVYPLFQGNQWTTRLEIGFSALFASVAAGLLVLLIALTLIMLKLGFLLLLVAGPFFLIVGTHPGFGRVVAMRWFEMLVGVLLKQIAVALTLSVLLYCYSLIMGTTDTALPWALKIIMIALVTVAVFIYRRPFQHLFSAVGYGMIGSPAAEGSFREATFGFRRATSGAAGVAAGVAGGAAGAMVPGVGAGLGARWARRFGEGTAPAATDTAGGGAGGGVAGAAAAAAGGVRSGAGGDGAAGRLRPPGGSGGADGPGAGAGSGGDGSGGSGGAGAATTRGRHWPDGGYGAAGRSAPPLPLPGSGSGGSSSSPRPGSGPGAASAGWARGAGTRSTGPMPRASAGSGSPRPTPPPSPPTPSPWTRPFRRGK